MTLQVTRLMLIDDHPLVRDGLRMRLETVPSLRVAAEAGDGANALRLLEGLSQDAGGLPDLVLLDLNLRGMSGLEVAAQLRERWPRIAVLVLTMHDSPEYVVQATKAGARGYLLKDEPGSEIIVAIEAVMAGRTYFSPSIALRLSRASLPTAVLTQREREVLNQIADGLPNKEIAHRLNLSVRTVETHRANIKRKLCIDGQAELIKFALEHRSLQQG